MDLKPRYNRESSVVLLPGPNNGKKLVIEVEGRRFARYPVKTKLITPEDKDISAIVKDYTQKYLQPEDIVFISEKAVAVTQGRSYPLKDIKASWLAKNLSKFVVKTPYVIGGLGKFFGINGLFYIVAGHGARSIDGAVPYAIPPYNEYVSKGPLNAKKISIEISKKINCRVVIVDANDIGVNVLGESPGIDKNMIAKIIKDNPLGQSDEQTPVGIIREIKD